jgi:hypothetical protein
MIKNLALFVFLTGVVNGLTAQTSTVRVNTGKVTKVAAFKPPKVKTLLGKNAQTATVSIDEAKQLINLPLKISNDSRNLFTIDSYQFMYKKKSVIQNEQTGKKEIVFTTVADLFKTTPLPEIWRKNIGASIQKQEEFYFFDIIVKDKLDRRFYAPDVKIIIQ